MKLTKMTKTLRAAALFLSIALIMMSFTACSTKNNSGKTANVNAKVSEAKTRTITDSCGRQVTIPAKIKKIAPSGALAQIMLYTLCPDKLAGLSSNFSDIAKKYIDKKYWSLPKFGQFYGKNVSLNMEALLAAAPDVIIDIGEYKDTEKSDMDGLQKQLGIPVIFVEATLKTIDKAYTSLGNIVGEEKQASVLAAYCKKTLNDIAEKSASISAADKKTVYYALGDTGLNTNAAGSIHADVIEAIGAVNVAKVQLVSTGGGSKVSMEQVISWNPDIIITAPNGIYDKLGKDTLWTGLKAVKDGNYYEIPNGPYNWMGEPPSINRVIGLKWLGNLLYPKVYNYDMVKETQEFYSKFYHVKLSNEQAKELLKNSTYKK